MIGASGLNSARARVALFLMAGGLLVVGGASALEPGTGPLQASLPGSDRQLATPGVPSLAAPDTILRDTIIPVRIPPTEPLPPDSVRARLAPASDTLGGFQEVRQVLPRNVPKGGGAVPVRSETGIWEFDREALLATHAMTLHDLMSLVPGLVLVRGGDYGNPAVATSAGLGPGEIRVFRDGVEDPPMEGGVVDLGQVALAGLQSVRVERRPGELRLHLESQRIEDVRPYSLLDVATGDLQTNIFRATFAHPNALGGTLLVALDRVDTEGPSRDEPGAVYGTHFRYALFPAEGVGLALHYRSRTAQRPPDVFAPVEVNRTDLGFRGGWELNDAVTLEGFGTRTTVSPGGEAAEGADSLLPADARNVIGARASGEWESWWTSARAQLQSGDGWASSVYGIEAGGMLDGIGGASVEFEREHWDEGEAGRSLHGRVWTQPRAGISLFAEVQDARRGRPFLVPPPVEPDDEENGDENGEGGDPVGLQRTSIPHRASIGAGGAAWTAGHAQDSIDDTLDEVPGFGERRGVRAGVRGRFGTLDLTAAYLYAEADSLAPFGMPFDRDAPTVEGGTRSGMEVEAHIPLTLIREGLSVSGHAQFWEAAPQWRYMPARNFAGALNWHHLGYDDNLEVWFDVGARGRDPMSVPVAGSPGSLETVPSSLSWFARLQFRVLTVRVFVHWENFTLRDNLQDVPGRFLPQTRAVYGIRWTMWN